MQIGGGVICRLLTRWNKPYKVFVTEVWLDGKAAPQLRSEPSAGDDAAVLRLGIDQQHSLAERIMRDDFPDLAKAV